MLTFSGLVRAEISEGYKVARFTGLDRNDANNGLQGRREIAVSRRTKIGGQSHCPQCRRTWTQRRKKLRLKSEPERTYLFMTVIRMDDPQYARTGRMGLLARELEDQVLLGWGAGASNSLLPGSSFPISMV